MTEKPQGRRRGRARMWLALSAVAVILALLVVPPFISVRRYKNRITQLVSSSVGRPVRLSSVELRVLPRPSFIISDLTVEEDPVYGAEPVLHANTVTASIRLLPLWWRARLEISRISVDEASLNLVRNNAGQWNLDSFFRTAAAKTQPVSGNRGAVPLPYLEATDSRVNIKDGVEKLPYSLVNADLSFWQENSGEWRVRLKGQPARTDVSLGLADTGVVRLEGRMQRAPELRNMPVHLDVVWREAQLGQLSRLVLADDAGWRGDLTGEIHIDGTAETAQVTTRLRASGVHREEFAPASPIDFDASCSFVYHYSDRGLEKLLCDSPIGTGRARLTGDLPGRGSQPRLTLELDRVPAQVGLDTLRTVRSGIDPSLQAAGAISGKITYSPAESSSASLQTGSSNKVTHRTARTHVPGPGPLAGSVSILGLRVNGDGLSKPISIPKVTVEPAAGQPPVLATNVAMLLGAPTPLTLTAKLTWNSYQVGMRGGIGVSRLRELAHVTGVSHAADLDKLEGPPAALDLTVDGPWLRAPASPAPDAAAGTSAGLPSTPVLVGGMSDHFSGTVTLHEANWKPDFLASPVELSNAVLRFDDSGARWDPVSFSYGAIRGTATLSVRALCPKPEPCTPQFTLDFGSLDASALQAAILGERRPGTLISGLISRLNPGSSPQWPNLEGIVRADSLLLGPITLTGPKASLRVQPDETDIESLDAGLLGGRVHIEGSVVPGDKPEYKIKGQFGQLSPTDLGRLLGMNWSGNPIDGTGDIEAVGFTDSELAESAKGSVHFDWRHGAVSEIGEGETPPALTRFDRWTANAEIINGAITLKQNQVQRGTHKIAIDGSATFGDPPHVTFGAIQNAQAADRQAKQ